jgi:putative hydrolase of the HAD superfamily
MLKAVLFDLGGTLIHYERPEVDFAAVGQEGLRGFYRALQEVGIALPPWDVFAKAFHSRFAEAVRVSRETLQSGSTDQVLREGLAGLGLTLPDGVWTACRAAYYAPVRAIIQPIEGAGETLQALAALGLSLGLVSNTFWPGDLHDADLAACGLLDLLPVRVYSSAAGYVKPHPEIYRLALAQVGARPEEAVFVGDRLREDVAGPQAIGLRAVLVEVPFREERDARIVPEARLSSLRDLPALIAAWLKGVSP